VTTLEKELDELAAKTAFSGVVRVDRGDDVLIETAWGLADRRWGIPNTVDTLFGIASGTKGLTALTIVSLIDEGVLSFQTPAREFLGEDLPLIRDDVTVEHLLAHRSGIGDYYDEELVTDFDSFELPVPVNKLATTGDYLVVLDGHPTKFAPDERFAYSNGGYVVLALIAERASATRFHELVVQRVCEPAGMGDTGFFRSDELPERTAVGYVDDARTNVFHLPVRGSGDGGIYTTVGDMRALWTSVFAGRIVSIEWTEEMVRSRSDSGPLQYGLGFWLDSANGLVRLHGADAGVSFVSTHDRRCDDTRTVVSNTSEGASPIARHLARADVTA
jgi:CubicO group peptidase (beta-lactamase class C family)